MTDLDSILEDHATPFYVLDIKTAVERYQHLNDAISQTVKYASKANFDPQLITALNAESCDFVCGSAFEAGVCYKYGVNAENIQVTAVAPSEKSINILTELADKHESFTTTANSFTTVQQLVNNGYSGRMLLRLPPRVNQQPNSKYQSGSQVKFGMTETELEKSAVLLEDSTASLHGIHSHMGGSFTDETLDKFRNHIRRTIDFVTDFSHQVEVINFGGGLGINYMSSDEAITLEKVATVLDEETTTQHEFVIEPGRYISGSIGTLVTTVRTVRETPDERFIGVDAGLAEFPRPTMFDVYHEIKRYVEDDKTSRPIISQTIAGPTCSGADIFASNRDIERLAVDDTVLIKDVGAYGQVMANNFHAYPFPTVVSKDGTESPPIRDVIDISDTFNTEL